MTIIAGLILSGMFYATEPIAKKNAAAFKKRAILSSISSSLDKPLAQMSDDEVLELFTTKMEQKVLNVEGDVLTGENIEHLSMGAEYKKPANERHLPLYTFTGKDGKINILAVYGNGLWDKISGYIALGADNKTIVGTSFDHKGETPGLGAEIKDDPTFSYRFIGKTIFDNNGKYTSVKVMKKVTDPEHQVDGIGGSTLTCDGVTDMMVDGLKVYLPYFEKNK